MEAALVPESRAGLILNPLARVRERGRGEGKVLCACGAGVLDCREFTPAGELLIFASAKKVTKESSPRAAGAPRCPASVASL